jgi:hypothetical protein
VAAGAKTAADLGAHLCFEDECGKTMRSPQARTWARRGHTPVIRVPGSPGGRVSVAGLACDRPGHRFRLLFRLHRYQRRKGENAGFTRRDYRDFLVLAHHELGTPIVLLRDGLNRHTRAEMTAFIEAGHDWLRVFRLPPYAPDLNPAEGSWSLLVRGPLANLAVAGFDELVRTVRHAPKKLQYRPDLIDGCLAETGLAISFRNFTH